MERKATNYMVNAIYLTPRNDGETFDLEAVEEFLKSKPHVLRDPVQPEDGPYMLSTDAEVLKYAIEKRLTEPDGAMPSVCLVFLKNDCITIGQIADEDDLELCREVAEWIVGQYKVNIGDDNGFDWTGQCEETLDPLYE